MSHTRSQHHLPPGVLGSLLLITLGYVACAEVAKRALYRAVETS